MQCFVFLCMLFLILLGASTQLFYSLAMKSISSGYLKVGAVTKRQCWNVIFCTTLKVNVADS